MTIAFGESASLAGLLADRPAADPNQIGRFYLATDEGSGVLYRDNGSSWDYAGGRRYKVLTMLMNAVLTSDPVLTILENTLGLTPAFTLEGGIEYRWIAEQPIFDETKMFVIFPISTNGSINNNMYEYWVEDAYTFWFARSYYYFNSVTHDFVYEGHQPGLANVHIELRFYS